MLQNTGTQTEHLLQWNQPKSNTQSIQGKQKHKLRNTKAQDQEHKPLYLSLPETHIQTHFEIKHKSKLKIALFEPPIPNPKQTLENLHNRNTTKKIPYPQTQN